jgi:large subunit ribosomal protein L12e
VQDKDIKHNGNLKLNDIIEIARVMAPRSCAKFLSGTCKEILGTCVSVGCTVEGEHPSVIMTKIDNGDVEIPDK